MTSTRPRATKKISAEIYGMKRANLPEKHLYQGEITHETAFIPLAVNTKINYCLQKRCSNDSYFYLCTTDKLAPPLTPFPMGTATPDVTAISAAKDTWPADAILAEFDQLVVTGLKSRIKDLEIQFFYMAAMQKS